MPEADLFRRRPRFGALRFAAIAFFAANVLHGLDHERQGTGRLTSEVVVGGTVLTVLALITLVLVLRANPRAPHVAAAVGIGSAIGVAASHLAPHWSAFSDPYPDLELGPLSWAIMLAEIATGAILGATALREARRRGVGTGAARGGPIGGAAAGGLSG